MKKLLPISAFVVLLFSACMKELSSIDELNPASEIPGNLRQMVTISWPDSLYRTTENFRYDANGRILDRSVVMNNFSAYTYFYRDGQGRVTKLAMTSSQTNWDTSFVQVVYESAVSDKVAYLSDSSAVFFYNANNQVSRTNSFQSIGGGPRKLVAYHLYTYDAVGNMTKREEFTDQDNNGTFELNFTYTLEYDTYINPLHPLDDALIEWQFLSISPNNLVKQKNDPANGGIDDENVLIYEFREDRKPHSSLFIGGDGRKTRTYYYYY